MPESQEATRSSANDGAPDDDIRERLRRDHEATLAEADKALYTTRRERRGLA